MQKKWKWETDRKTIFWYYWRQLKRLFLVMQRSRQWKNCYLPRWKSVWEVLRYSFCKCGKVIKEEERFLLKTIRQQKGERKPFGSSLFSKITVLVMQKIKWWEKVVVTKRDGKEGRKVVSYSLWYCARVKDKEERPFLRPEGIKRHQG